MFETAYTLSLSQFARTLSFPERIQKRPGRNSVLEVWRARNTGIDSLFYDVGTLTTEEVYYISDAIAAEGLIMIVPPRGGPMLTICETIDEFVARGGRKVSVLAVAGMGGSAVGAAAFARNVADAVGSPVAAVVSGYGLGDIVSESMGASFLFGWLGRIRSQCEMIDDVIGRPHFGAYGDRATASDTAGLHACLDVETVEGLLADKRLDLGLLVSHSRGSLVLSEALSELEESDAARLSAIAATTRIITFGAHMPLPAEFHHVTNVMGGYDWYGEMNSHPGQGTEMRVPMAGHSTNASFPGALRVTTLLQTILADAPAKAPAAEPVKAPPAKAALAETMPSETGPEETKPKETKGLPFAPQADAAPAIEADTMASDQPAIDTGVPAMAVETAVPPTEPDRPESVAEAASDTVAEVAEDTMDDAAAFLSGKPGQATAPSSEDTPLAEAAKADAAAQVEESPPSPEPPSPEPPAPSARPTAANSDTRPAAATASKPALARTASITEKRARTDQKREAGKTPAANGRDSERSARPKPAVPVAPRPKAATPGPDASNGAAPEAALKPQAAQPGPATSTTGKPASAKSSSKARRAPSGSAGRRSRRTDRH
ncbi:cell envelope biogenesis protein OmpA [Rhizobium halophytocola]|uniref:Cell envelope biogenesis protein OmpA n=1 Tax=Rhizobium halophytocola TaxID=735519 RepID=A0ABS4E3R6_9HYPH|nr:cell envelope biogenesis protein OmpA [Rhizobium halophytocola]MBP1852577.1 hypothetical protein [Rhizobium halophytocola]